MDHFSRICRSLKLIAGWILVMVFGGTFVVSVFDDVTDNFGVILLCFFFAAAGVWMIVSAKRSRKAEIEKQDAIKAVAAKAPKPKIKSFVVVECPNCGATASVEKGCVGRCEYCGGIIGSRT